jgi:hypothetical protein
VSKHPYLSPDPNAAYDLGTAAEKRLCIGAGLQTPSEGDVRLGHNGETRLTYTSYNGSEWEMLTGTEMWRIDNDGMHFNG